MKIHKTVASSLAIAGLSIMLGKTQLAGQEVRRPAEPVPTASVTNPQEIRQVVQNVFSDDRLTRLLATSHLRILPSYIKSDLRPKLADPGFWTNRDSEGSSAQALGVIGQWRFADFAPVLSENIGFEIDAKTVPVGAKLPPSAPYPAAAALAEIGGKETRQVVLRKLTRTADEKERRLCLWVLTQSEGKEWVETVLVTALKDAVNLKGKENLEEALKLLRANTPLLPPRR